MSLKLDKHVQKWVMLNAVCLKTRPPQKLSLLFNFCIIYEVLRHIMWAGLHPNTVVVVCSQSDCCVSSELTPHSFELRRAETFLVVYMEIREAAALRQQRRIKQAIQFLHKDSADLLPLDGLNKLGTSKEWVRQALVKAILQNVCQSDEAYSAMAPVEILNWGRLSMA